ncbi:plastocyanin/azurin family copper-binding protein, partial [Frankia sp. AvcI1]
MTSSPADRDQAARPADPGSPGRRASRAAALLGLVLAVLLGVAGCGGDGGSSPSAGPTLSATQGTDGVQVFAVTGLPSMKFSATELLAKPGKIRVDFSVAQGSAPHNFVVPRIPAAHTSIVSAGESQSVTFTVTEPGDYPVVCTLHPNMTATLKI